MRSAGEEVDVGIVEAGHDELAGEIDHLGRGADPLLHVGGRAHRHDARADRGDGLRARIPFVDGPDIAVQEDQVRGRLRRCLGHSSKHKEYDGGSHWISRMRTLRNITVVIWS